MKKKVLKKAQKGMSVKPTTDSTKYYKDEAKFQADLASTYAKYGNRKMAEEAMEKSRKAYSDASRQQFKGKPGFNTMGKPINKKIGGTVKTKKK